jgi:hypothetical protein
MRNLPVLLVLSLLLSAGCAVDSSKVKNPQDFMKDLTYVKDSKTGICFAMVAIEKGGGVEQVGIGMAAVDCEKAGL